jgi:hypothetical protein
MGSLHYAKGLQDSRTTGCLTKKETNCMQSRFVGIVNEVDRTPVGAIKPPHTRLAARELPG